MKYYVLIILSIIYWNVTSFEELDMNIENPFLMDESLANEKSNKLDVLDDLIFLPN